MRNRVGALHQHDMHCSPLCEEVVNRSDLEKIIAKGEYFGGAVVAVHRIGEYAILEYLDRDYRGGSNPNYGKLTGEHTFSTFINECSTSHGYNSLDAALVGVIAFKRDGCNTCADRYFMKATEPENGRDRAAEIDNIYYVA